MQQAGNPNEPQFEFHSDMNVHWSTNVVQPVLIAMLAVSFAAAPIPIISIVWLDLPWMWLLLPMFIISVSSVYTTFWMLKPRQRSLNHSMYRASELVILIVIARFVAWSLTGNWPQFGSGIYLLRPRLLLFDPVWFVSIGFMWLAWLRTIVIGRIFFGLSPEGARYSVFDILLLPPSSGQSKFSPMQSRKVYWDAYVSQWLIGGVFIIMAAALSSVDLLSVPETGLRSMLRLDIRPATLFLTMIYFGVGLLLMSQTRLALRHIQWSKSTIKLNPGVERAWVRQTIWLLVIVAALAVFLPLGPTFLLGDIVVWIIIGLYQFSLAVSLLILWLISLLFPNIETEAPPEEFEAVPLEPIPTPNVIPSEPAAAAEPSAITGAFFWIILITFVVIAALFFIQQRDFKIGNLDLKIVWASLKVWWQSIWKRVSTRAAELRDVVVMQFVRDEDETGGRNQQPWRFIRVNALTPRQKLRYFYLSTTERAAQRGVGRVDSETPIEYSTDLKESFPTAGQPIEIVTNAFLKARYSEREITAEEAAEVQAYWKQLRSELKRRPEEKKEVEQAEEGDE